MKRRTARAGQTYDQQADTAMNEREKSTATVAADWLEQALLDDGREHRARYIADDGFTARVATSLPPPAALPAWRKPTIAVLWTAAAAGLALALPGAATDLARDLARLVSSHPVSLGNIATGVVALGLATWAATAVALRRND